MTSRMVNTKVGEIAGSSSNEAGREKLILLASADTELQAMTTEIVSQISRSWLLWRASGGRHVLSILGKLSPEEYPKVLLIDRRLDDMTPGQLLDFVSKKSGYDYVSKFIMVTAGENMPVTSFPVKGIRLIERPQKASDLKAMLIKMFDLTDRYSF